MSTTTDTFRIIGAIESFLPIVTGLVRDLRGLLAGSGSRSVEEILAEADANWAAVLANARKDLGP